MNEMHLDNERKMSKLRAELMADHEAVLKTQK